LFIPSKSQAWTLFEGSLPRGSLRQQAPHKKGDQLLVLGFIITQSEKPPGVVLEQRLFHFRLPFSG
jgi:hypothetical protein